MRSPSPVICWNDEGGRRSPWWRRRLPRGWQHTTGRRRCGCYLQLTQKQTCCLWVCDPGLRSQWNNISATSDFDVSVSKGGCISIFQQRSRVLNVLAIHIGIRILRTTLFHCLTRKNVENIPSEACHNHGKGSFSIWMSWDVSISDNLIQMLQVTQQNSSNRCQRPQHNVQIFLWKSCWLGEIVWHLKLLIISLSWIRAAVNQLKPGVMWWAVRSICARIPPFTLLPPPRLWN